MICSHCHKNEANTHYMKTVNGKTEELFLCSECAKKLGIMKELESFTMDSLFGNFLGAGLSSLNSLTGIDRCSFCGSSFNDIVNSGKVGCANCYEKFVDQLQPSLDKIHGNAKHIGKNITYTKQKEPKELKLEKLKDDLSKAIKEQRFEDAAIIRDEINALNEED